jgi:cholesterol oxidase
MPEVGVQFHEVMKGWVAVPLPTFRDSEGAWLEIRAQVVIENLDAFLADESHRGQLVGTIHFDPLGDKIPATGHVELFTINPGTLTRLMRYQAFFEVNGIGYLMIGTKYVSKSAGPNVWGHTTTLFTTIARAGSHGYDPVGAGIIRLSIWEGARMLFTLRGTGAGSLAARMNAVFRFARFFAGAVSAVYFH